MNRCVPFTNGAAIGVRRLGDWIFHNRISHGMSQRELGIDIDVDRKTIIAWETGQRVPTVDAVCRMMEAFGVDKFTIDISEPSDYSDNFPKIDTK